MKIEKLINGFFKVTQTKSGLVGIYNEDGNHRGLFNFGKLF